MFKTKMLNRIKNQRGFVLAEFVIALPLLILLLYALVQMIIQTSKLAKIQATDYILQSEAQEILEQITRDARAASSVAYTKSEKFETIIFVFHANANANYFLTTDKNEIKDIIDVRDTRRYIRYSKPYTEPIYHIYAQRQDAITSPISGGNFLGETSVTEFKFSSPSEKVLHITLEIRSLATERKLKVSTSVFMPACEEMSGI